MKMMLLKVIIWMMSDDIYFGLLPERRAMPYK